MTEQVVGTMESSQNQERAVEVLKECGLKEYEAKSFVALSRTSSATAKEISEIIDVPRTRVYDAARVLEAEGLVEIQHSNPQQYRGVPIDEAISTLQNKHESRMATLRESLREIEPAEESASTVQEVWSFTGSDAAANRTQQLIENATEEVVLVVGSNELLSEDLLDSLRDASHELTVVVGALTESARDKLREAVPEASVFVSELEWLRGLDGHQEETAIGRLLLIDREQILVSSIEPESGNEKVIVSGGFDNGLVVIARRIMATGLIPAEDPGDAYS